VRLGVCIIHYKSWTVSTCAVTEQLIRRRFVPHAVVHSHLISMLLGYTIERRELPDGRWLKCNFSNVIETEFTISGLTENADYEFRYVFSRTFLLKFYFISKTYWSCSIRVFAKNSAGAISEASQASEPVTCRHEVAPPRVEFDAELRDSVTVKSGDSVKLDARISGKSLANWRCFALRGFK